MSTMTSRDRMLRAIRLQEPDHVPCAFMSFTALRKRVNEDFYELAKAELALGLDSFLFIPSLPRPLRPDHPELRGLPVRPHHEVRLKERREKVPGGSDIMHKEYITPGGNLTTSVRLSDDWPHGNHIPFIDDYQVSRAIKPLVTQRNDLAALQFLLTPPKEEDVASFQQEVHKAQRFAQEQGVMLVGGWGIGMDMANWLCGIQNLMMLSIDEEAFIGDLLEMIHAWNRKRMEVVLSAPVDLYIRRAWYEGCDFITPGFFRRQILPRLKTEVDLVHDHGTKFGYICSSGLQPMLSLFSEAGIDVLIGIDPVQGTYTNLTTIKEKIGDTTCLWGGVSGAVTVELGSEAQVRSAVQQAISTLGPNGFILSPVDNITIDAPQTWQNIQVFIDEWKKGW